MNITQEEDLNYNETVRASILDVSRVLFAKFGYKKTTMEDIAHELHKGKSSLYYYFKNKEEIFQAVVDFEQETLLSQLRDIINSDKNAKDKLHDYFYTRMKTIIDLENYYKALTDKRFGGGEFVERVKERDQQEEEDMMEAILNQGLEEGIFQLNDTKVGAITITLAFKGLENAFIKTSAMRDNFSMHLENSMNILFYGVVKR